MMLGSLKQPEKHLLVAYQDGKPVARLAIKIHRHAGHEYLHFGFYESLKVGPEPTRALFEAARARYPRLSLHGPYHFRMEDVYTGLLVEDFEDPPQFFMPYNPPYYEEYFLAAGLKQQMDLYCYEYEPAKMRLDILEPRAQIAREQGFTVRNLNSNKLKLPQESQLMAEIFNDALSDNWGFETLEKDQISDLVALAGLFLDPEYVFFAEKDGRAVGCVIVLPNFNRMIKRSNGGITPGFLWEFLFQRKKIDEYRGYAVGLRKEFRKTEVSSLLADAVMKRIQKGPCKTFEVGWILSNNRPMNMMAVALGGRRSKILRIYEGAV
jgi:hypothetical protein